MSKEISFEDIREGDLLRVWQTYEQKGVEYSRTLAATAHELVEDAWRTKEGGHIISTATEMCATITLLNRPKPPLPTTPGTVFRATEIRGEKCDVIVFVIEADHAEDPYIYATHRRVIGAISHTAEHITAWEPIENGDK